MSEPIKVGDLVMVVHQCCEFESQLGEIYIVGILRVSVAMECEACGWRGVHDSAREYPRIGYAGNPLPWLKRIPPLEELDDVKREEEIAA